MLFVVCCLLCVGCCVLFVVYWLLCVVCGLMVRVVCCLLCVVGGWWVLPGVRCSLFAAC